MVEMLEDEHHHDDIVDALDVVGEFPCSSVENKSNRAVA
jgi:hypothetical protein